MTQKGTALLQFPKTSAAGRRSAAGALVAAVGVAAALLAGCDRNDPRTPGQKLDSALASTGQKLEGLKGEARVAGQEARSTAERIGDRIEAVGSDAGITAKVKTRIATDAELNALKIDVDTAAGRVVLRGTVASAAARQRAASLAKGVEGVLAVDNQLVVAPPG